MSMSFEKGDFYTLRTFGKDIRQEVEIDNIPIIFERPLWYRVIENNICLDVFLYLRRQKQIYIFGQDALTEGRSDLPYFYRVQWFNEFSDASFITVNDPTLYLDRSLRGGWWQLDGGIQLVGKFIKNLVIALNSDEKNLVFYGASAGGYFSMACAGLFPKSKAVGDVFQVDLPSSPYAFNVPILNKFGIYEFKDIFRYWNIDKLPENIYILMNNRDFPHIKSQLSYFLNYLNEHYHMHGKMIQNLVIKGYDNEDDSLRAHSPWQKESIVDFLKTI